MTNKAVNIDLTKEQIWQIALAWDSILAGVESITEDDRTLAIRKFLAMTPQIPKD